MTILIAGQPIPYDDLHHYINQPAIWIAASGRRMNVIIGEKFKDDGEWDTFTIKPQGDFYDQPHT